MRWLFLAISLLVMTAHGQSLESALMPGPVIRDHTDAEHECKQCHIRGDRSAQPGLCLECHKPVATDVKSGQGYHGRLRDRSCRNCHTEHKGREARIVKLDTQHFDHDQTDFILKGKHQGRKCESCHPSGEAFRKAPSACIACHRKEDKHKGGLGEKCGSCHQEANWKDARFDHGKTRFPLKLSHAEGECSACHKDEHYTNTPRECVSCHRKDDKHKGGYGAVCEKCHNEGEWKQLTFRHDRDTHFPLVDRHRTVKCESCHRSSPFREKTPTRCITCHRNDDAHKGSLGDKCEKCHSARGWKETRFDHDLDTKFPLREKHAKAKCQSCHKDDAGRPAGERSRSPTPTRCFTCHDRDDKEKGHKGNFGEKCESCHTERGFKYGSFNHDRETGFTLRDKHQKAKCATCHRTPLYSSKTDGRCVACHDKDDVHFTSYGSDCQRCHISEDWRKIIRQEVDRKEMKP